MTDRHKDRWPLVTWCGRLISEHCRLGCRCSAVWWERNPLCYQHRPQSPGSSQPGSPTGVWHHWEGQDGVSYCLSWWFAVFLVSHVTLVIVCRRSRTCLWTCETACRKSVFNFIVYIIRYLTQEFFHSILCLWVASVIFFRRIVCLCYVAWLWHIWEKHVDVMY